VSFDVTKEEVGLHLRVEKEIFWPTGKELSGEKGLRAGETPKKLHMKNKN